MSDRADTRVRPCGCESCYTVLKTAVALRMREAVPNRRSQRLNACAAAMRSRTGGWL